MLKKKRICCQESLLQSVLQRVSVCLLKCQSGGLSGSVNLLHPSPPSCSCSLPCAFFSSVETCVQFENVDVDGTHPVCRRYGSCPSVVFLRSASGEQSLSSLCACAALICCLHPVSRLTDLRSAPMLVSAFSSQPQLVPGQLSGRQYLKTPKQKPWIPSGSVASASGLSSRIFPSSLIGPMMLRGQLKRP